MSNFVNLSIFENYQKYIDNEQEIREVRKSFSRFILGHTKSETHILSFQRIRLVVREIEQLAKEATIQLQVIHCDLTKGE